MLFFIYYATPVLYFVISGDTLYHDLKDDSVSIMCVSLASVSMNCWCLLEPSSVLKVIVMKIVCPIFHDAPPDMMDLPIT
jgi:hypothetical protein